MAETFSLVLAIFCQTNSVGIAAESTFQNQQAMILYHCQAVRLWMTVDLGETFVEYYNPFWSQLHRELHG